MCVEREGTIAAFYCICIIHFQQNLQLRITTDTNEYILKDITHAVAKIKLLPRTCSSYHKAIF